MVTRLDAAQVARNNRGLAACRLVVAQALARRQQPAADEQQLTRSDQLLAAARAEAARQRNTRTPEVA